MSVQTEMLGHGDTVATYAHYCTACDEQWFSNSAVEPECPFCGAEDES